MIKRLKTDEQREGIAGIKESILAGKTPAQIENWINTNVTDLASAKTALKYLAKAIYYLAKNQGLLK